MTAQTFRHANRAANALRPVRITRNYTRYAEGSVLIEVGETKVLCNASVEEKVPSHKKGSGEGWVTAEYGMLPRATHTRGDREAARGKQPHRGSAGPAARRATQRRRTLHRTGDRPVKQIEVVIMGQSYVLGCPDGGEPSLLAAVITTLQARSS